MQSAKALSTVTSRSIRALLAYCCLSAGVANACDMCAVYSASDLSGIREGSLAISIQQESTKYRTPFAHDSANEQLTRSSSTRLSLSYDVTDNFQAQLTLPYSSQRFVSTSVTDTESGIGDAILLFAYAPVNIREMDRSVFWSIRGGIKVPSGDTGKLETQIDADMAESMDMDAESTSHSDTDHTMIDMGGDAAAAEDHNQMSMEEHSHMLLFPKHGGHLASSAGRTLALGTGSYDFLVGTNFVGRTDRYLLVAGVQYVIRSEGDFNYRFDNTTTWNAGPGYYLLLDDAFTIAVRAAASGEHKGNDIHQGNKMEGSGLSDVYFGPELLFTVGESLSGYVGFDTPIAVSDLEVNERPDYRVRLAVTYRF